MKYHFPLHWYVFFLPCYFFLATSLAFAENNSTIIPDAHFKSKNFIASSPSTAIETSGFDREAIATAPSVNLSELFQTQQSVVRLTNNSAATHQPAVSVRGFGDNAAANSLILIDGFPLTNPSLLAPNFNSIPLSDVDHIDIFQGSEGVLWGDQAVGGVINITTKHPRKFFIDSIVSVGSYHRQYYQFLIANRFNNGIFLKIFGLIGATNNFRKHNQQNDNNIAAQIGYDYARGSTLLNAQTYGSRFNFPGGLSKNEFEHHRTAANEWRNHSDYRTTLLQLLNKNELPQQWLMETRLDYHETTGNGVMFVPFHRLDASSNLRLRILGDINRYHVIAGYDVLLSRFQFTNISIQSQTKAAQNSGYVQTRFPLRDNLQLTLGARVALQQNKIEEFIGHPVSSNNRVLVTEQGLFYQFSKSVAFFLRRDGNFRFPKANEETWLPTNTKALQVQTGVSYETGAEWQTEKHKTQLRLYRLDLQDEIAFNPAETPRNPFGSFMQFKATERDGLTLTDMHKLTEKATIHAELNYVRARFSTGLYSGKSIPAVPSFNGNLRLNYTWTEHWQTQYAILYTGARYAADNLANMGSKLSSDWVQDVALTYLMKYGMLSAEIHNVFNEHYPAYAFYNPYFKENTYFPAPGRNFLLTAKLNID